MKKLSIIFCISLVTAIQLNAQVGVNTNNPKSVLDIEATNSSAPTITDGLIVPRVDVLPASNPGADQDGMMVFLTTTINGNKKGHHYWDNTAGEWTYFAGEWVDGYNKTSENLTYVKQAFKENQKDVVILDTGQMGMGTDDPDESLEIKLPGDNDIQIASNASRPNAPNFIFFTKNGTFASGDFLNDGDVIGSLSGTVWDGSTESDIVVSINSAADGDHLSGDLASRFNFSVTSAGNTSADADGMEMTVRASGNVGIGVDNPTAVLHLKAGTASSNSAPIKFNSGTNLTSPEKGTFEYDGVHLYFTPGADRKILLKKLSGTATLDFLSLFAGLHTEQTVTVNGATPGSSCNCSPVGAIENGLTWSCYVSANNTVTIRLSNITGSPIDPVSKNWIVNVIE
ncbi:MAG: hypothetical protein HKP11_12220 [Flavobacteriaceae bacterium]|nr:hypothetical protein [Flavobacteriaceae bacterium]